MLLLGTPAEVLSRLVQSDRLDLRSRVGERLRRRALLFDAPAVLRRTYALVAYGAPAWRGRPGLARWLDERVDAALDELLEEEAERVLDAVGSMAELGAALGLRGERLARARRAFHALEPRTREAFIALVVEGRELDDFAREGHESAVEIARRARVGLEAWRLGSLGRTA